MPRKMKSLSMTRISRRSKKAQGPGTSTSKLPSAPAFRADENLRDNHHENEVTYSKISAKSQSKGLEASSDEDDPIFGSPDSFQMPNSPKSDRSRRKSVSFRLPSSDADHDPSSANGNEGKVVEELRRNFHQLTVLRTTAAEKLLDEYKTKMSNQLAAAEKLIDSLKKENEELHRKFAMADSIKGRRLSDISSNSGLNESKAASTIEFLEKVCGLQAEPKELSESMWHCVIKGRLGEFTFDLEYDGPEQQYSYRPTFALSSPMADKLPAYLKEEIIFDSDQLQLFFWRALNFLMTTPNRV